MIRKRSLRRLVVQLLVGLVALGCSGGTRAAPAAGAAEDRTPLLVGYTPRGIDGAQTLEHAVGAQLVSSLDQIATHLVTVPRDRAAAALLLLRSDQRVRYAQLDRRAHALRIPNDEFWAGQWSSVRTHSPEAWDLTTGSPQVTVAVVDTGVNAAAADLAGKVLPGYDFVNGDADPRDDNGHGTAVAGIIAAQGDNSVGVAGFCWQCRILPLKVLGADGTGAWSAVASGILWAVDHGSRVINTSLGGPADDLTVAAAAQYAQRNGVLVVAAAGNDAGSILSYPADLPGVLSVGASDEKDELYSFSNSGAALAAPGENLTTGSDDGYVSFVGTSSAAPVVSGIAGLAFAVAPAASPAQVTQALEQGAAPARGVVYGRVDAYATLRLLGATPGVSPPPQVSPSPAARRAGESTRFTGRIARSERGRRFVIRTGAGVVRATLSLRSLHRSRVELRLVAPDGSVVARTRGSSRLRLRTKVDPTTYRLAVRRRPNSPGFAFTLAVRFPAVSTA
jgi:hypothetical protein